MKIPKKFKLFGSTIKIIFDNNKGDEDSAYGQTRYKKNTIILQDFVHGASIDKSEIESTAIHETVHFILNRLGYDELNDDEKFVKQLSGALHQILTTMEY